VSWPLPGACDPAGTGAAAPAPRSSLGKLRAFLDTHDFRQHRKLSMQCKGLKKMKVTASKNIIISGWYGQFNAGDDAILDVFIEQTKARIDCDIAVLSEAPHNIHDVRALPHPVAFGRGALGYLLDGSYFRHLNKIRHCDLFVLGGGGLLRDNTNWRNLVRLLDEIWIAKLFGRKVMLYAIGVGPFKSRLGKWLIGRSVNMCDLITVRSERCAALLREIGIAPKRIHLVADPAFLLAPQAPDDPELAALFSSGKKIGFYPTYALLRGFPDDSHLKRLAAALDRLVETEGAEIVAMPMSVRSNGVDDVLVANLIRAAMKYPEALAIYEKRLTAPELKWVTAKAKLNITVRLHAMIFSLGTDVPVVAVNYEPKVGNVFAAFGAPECLVEIDDRLGSTLADATSRCIRNLASSTHSIAEQRAITTASSAKTFDLMAAL
jgi:polysaccharide pyruvyl transferase CsaB